MSITETNNIIIKIIRHFLFHSESNTLLNKIHFIFGNCVFKVVYKQNKKPFSFRRVVS